VASPQERMSRARFNSAPSSASPWTGETTGEPEQPRLAGCARQLWVRRTKVQVTAWVQLRHGGKTSPCDNAISTEWHPVDFQMPDAGHLCPVRPLMRADLLWDRRLTRRARLATLNLLKVAGAQPCSRERASRSGSPRHLTDWPYFLPRF